MRRRAEAAKARTDTRAWAVSRRERTRHLIELGGLVQKAGLVDLTGDNRAAIMGGLLAVADTLAGDARAASLQLYERRGARALSGPPREPR
jgi:hypothetical protein